MSLGFNKRGQSSNVAVTAMGIVFGLFVLALVLLAGFNDWDFVYAINTVSDFTTQVLTPLIGSALGLDGGTNDFLMILTFILMIIVIAGTLDSANIFNSNGNSGKWINLAMGIIISIIGVRFMPSDIWASLVSPSTALVATILVGIPFAALFFITMRLKSGLARKLLWLFYLVFMTYLVVRPGASTTGFKWVYFIFMALAAVVMFFDASVRAWFYKEKAETEISTALGRLGNIERYNLRKEIKENFRILGDSSSTPTDIATAKTEIKRLEKLYGDLSAI